MSFKPFVIVSSLCFLFACGEPDVVTEKAAIQTQSQSDALQQWFEEKFSQQLQFSPMQMTSLGMSDRKDEIDDMSLAAVEKKQAWKAQTVKELTTKFNYDTLSDEDKLSYDIWLYQYQADQAMSAFSQHRYLFTQLFGPQSSLPSFLINMHTVKTKQDMLDYITRIEGISRALGQNLARTQQSADMGIRAPYFAYDGVIEQAQNQLQGRPFTETENDSALYADAKQKIAKLLANQIISEDEAQTLTTQTEAALIKHFEPQYQALIAWFKADYANVSQHATGASQLPDGLAYYNATLKQNTTTDMSADEIHQLGLSEVTRIRKEMIRIKQQVEFKGDLLAFFDSIKRDTSNPLFYYPNTDAGRQAYLDDATAYLDNIQSKLPDFFGVLPKAPLEVKRVESYREQAGAPQHYSRPSTDGSRPGRYYAHLLDMTTMPKNEMEAIAYHEGNPGHHMQIAIQQELTSVPTFRTQAFFSSYVEGWALYAEVLAKEMGGYQSQYSQLGQLVSEMWRAIRLVVDTGIHAKGWTEEQAVEYFRQNSPVAEGTIKAEVQRYFVWPGQATNYKIGMIKIMALRQKAEDTLGDKFDIRSFHDMILGGGAVPLDILERHVDHWIKQQ
jgi:uncharacterized protein (DUF885 family)